MGGTCAAASIAQPFLYQLGIASEDLTFHAFDGPGVGNGKSRIFRDYVS